MNKEKIMKIEKEYLEENCPEIFEMKNGIVPSYNNEEITLLCRIYHICTVCKVDAVSEKAEELLKLIKNESFRNIADIYRISDDNNLIKWLSDNINSIENFLCTLIFAYEDFNIDAEDILECLNILNNAPNDEIKLKYIDLLECIKSLSLQDMLWSSYKLSHSDNETIHKTIPQLATVDEIVDIIIKTKNSSAITVLSASMITILNKLPYNKEIKDIIWKNKYDGDVGTGLIIYMENDSLSDFYNIDLTKEELETIVKAYLNMDFDLKDNLIEEFRELKYVVDYLHYVFNKETIKVNVCDELQEIYQVLREQRHTFDITNMSSREAYAIIVICYLKHKLHYLDDIFNLN